MFENTTFNPGLNLVRDKKTLKRMANANCFKYPIDNGHIYVDEENRSRSFCFEGIDYRIDYLDGCFYPFVFKLDN